MPCTFTFIPYLRVLITFWVVHTQEKFVDPKWICTHRPWELDQVFNTLSYLYWPQKIVMCHDLKNLEIKDMLYIFFMAF